MHTCTKENELQSIIIITFFMLLTGMADRTESSYSL